MRFALVGTAAIAASLTIGGVQAAAQSTSVEPAAAQVVSVEEVDARTRDLTIESPAVGDAQVRLLLPEAFDEQPDARFPVLYLLHGGGGGYTDWTKNTDVEAFTAATDMIVAMPDAASSGLGTWLPQGGPDGEGGPPNWERFHLLELRELLERDWQASEERVVAGLSLGGYGAMMYASRHPEAFETVASYSGVLDLTVEPGDSEAAEELIEQATQMAEGAGWDEANPINLVSSLEETPPYVSYGNGEPGPLDPADTEEDALERWVGKGGDNYVAALTEADIPAAVNAYGPGTHSWTYWDRELCASLPMLLEALGLSADPACATSSP